MALPEHIPEAPGVQPAAEPEPDAESRHLQPVPDSETTGEIPIVIDEADADADVGTERVDEGQDQDAEPSRWRQVTETVRFDVPLFTERPYSAAEVWARSRGGQQVAETGPARWGATAHGVVATAWVYTLNARQWVVATPTRMAVAALLTAAVLFVPALQPIAYVLTWIPAQINALTG